MSMLRGRAALSCALILAAALWALPAAANQTVGAGCSGSAADSPQSGDGNNVYCNGSTIQYPAYQFGSSSATCNSTNAGRVQWMGSGNGSYFAGCNGTAWAALGGYCVATTSNTGLSTWENQGTAIETDTSTGMLLEDGGYSGGGQAARHLCKTAPATPYSIIALVGWNEGAFDWGGMEWRNTSNGNSDADYGLGAGARAVHSRI